MNPDQLRLLISSIQILEEMGKALAAHQLHLQSYVEQYQLLQRERDMQLQAVTTYMMLLDEEEEAEAEEPRVRRFKAHRKYFISGILINVCT